MESLSPDKASKWFDLFQKFFQKSLLKYLKDDDFERLFSDLLNDIARKKSPVIIADKLSNILEKKISAVHSGMQNNQEEYYNFMEEIVASIRNHFDMSIHVWKDRVIYFRDVERVWIACEPMLDLIDNDEGSFDLLERQLRHVDEIVYFVSNKSYFDDLVKILQERDMDISKLRLVKIPQKLPYPVVIYHSKNYRHGMRGRYQPEIKKDDKGKYYFSKKLDTDWMYYLTKEIINKHYEELNCLIVKN